VSDDKSTASQVERWISVGATIVAPVTVIGALLFYFGYVSSRSQYAYFGVDVDTIGLSTQDYIMRSPQPLLVPLLVLTLGGAGLLWLDAAVARRVASAAAGATSKANVTTSGSDPAEAAVRMARRSAIAGLAMLTVGVLLLLSYPYVRDWALYALATPLLFALGAALIAYASRIRNLLERGRREHARVTDKDAGSVRKAAAPADVSMLSRRVPGVLIYVVIAASIFWATATIAQWSGLGLAQYDAQRLRFLPSVILDTKERLFLRDPGIEETALPASDGQTFRYRYRHLRLLIEGHDRMFLVPDSWSASDSTLIVPLDGSVRVQFQFQNQPP